jgi:glycosyltransferase involved in cell wall biosynthesis
VRRERAYLVQNRYGGGTQASRAEARAALGLDQDDEVVGWIGRMSEEKAPDVFIEASIQAAREDTIWLMIGSGPMLRRIKARASTAPGGPGRRRLVGARPDAASMLPAFDVFVISSRTEGLPMVLFEAMAAEVPIVAVAVGGIPEVLGEGAGWLVPTPDERALGSAICEALDRREESARRANAARRILESRFGVKDWLAEVGAVYERVVTV